MKEVIIATKNEGKVREFKAMLEPRGYDVKSLLDIGYTPEIEETGQTFEENAVIKAETISKETGKIVIADDSGLSVDYLGGSPGVYSARYAGEEKNDLANLKKLLKELEGVEKEDRSASSDARSHYAFQDRKRKRSKVLWKDTLPKNRAAQTASATTRFFSSKTKIKRWPSSQAAKRTKSATERKH